MDSVQQFKTAILAGMASKGMTESEMVSSVKESRSRLSEVVEKRQSKSASLGNLMEWGGLGGLAYVGAPVAAAALGGNYLGKAMNDVTPADANIARREEMLRELDRMQANLDQETLRDVAVLRKHRQSGTV